MEFCSTLHNTAGMKATPAVARLVGWAAPGAGLVRGAAPGARGLVGGAPAARRRAALAVAPPAAVAVPVAVPVAASSAAAVSSAIATAAAATAAAAASAHRALPGKVARVSALIAPVHGCECDAVHLMEFGGLLDGTTLKHNAVPGQSLSLGNICSPASPRQ